MKITLEGKVALVTGGGAGIGRGIVDAFKELGAKIAVLEIDAGKCEKLKADLGSGALVVQGDVQKTEACKSAIEQIGSKFGRLDVLVNNVGHHLYNYGPIETMDEKVIDDLYNINLRQLFIMTKAAIPLMRKSGQGGSIINVSSIEGFRGCTYNVAYTAFKHGVTGFTKGMALELSADKIRVNTIAPETTDSEQVPLDKLIRPQYKDKAALPIPLGRYGTPADHAGAAVFLATDLSSWVTGTTVHVDGGGLAAGGFQRTPDGFFTVSPVVVDTAMG
ncbi:MAG TPA: SDR family oxidoreductase [Alphaproteobacteria bacterium]|nr:SDR family oxidoreductase [Alphaproteobacteria bacterium]